MAAKTIIIFFITVFLTSNFVQIKADQKPRRFKEVLAGLESENEISDLNEKYNQLSTAQEAIEDDSFFMEHKSEGNLTCYSCQPPDCDHPMLCHNATRCYIAIARETDGFVSKSKGCTRNKFQESFHCSTKSHNGVEIHKKKGRSAQYGFDCCKENMCNENATFPELPSVPVLPTKDENSNSDSNWTTILTITVSLALVALLVVSLILCKMHKNYKKEIKKLPANLGDVEMQGLFAKPVGDSTLRDEFGQNMSCEMTSGSGSGFPKLITRSFAKDIVYSEINGKIGGGRYGMVWKGTYRGDDVAVKIFNTRDEDSFKRETRIYNTYTLHHPNILQYIGTDVASINSSTHMLLVTQYHERGSLFDYLNRDDISLTTDMAYKLIRSALAGLVHLHTEMYATATFQHFHRPAIAHRDIKSKNILINKANECVLADFGLAVSQEELPTLELTKENNTRVGTKRYMSPEVLDFSIIEQSKHIESFKSSDMYSFALVMWEILRKTSCGEFQLPYYLDVTGPDPSFEEMRKIVCDGQKRPDIPNEWRTNRFMDGLRVRMEDCWHEKPNVRPTSLNLKKNLEKLKAEMSETSPSRGTYVPPPIIS